MVDDEVKRKKAVAMGKRKGSAHVSKTIKRVDFLSNLSRGRIGESTGLESSLWRVECESGRGGNNNNKNSNKKTQLEQLTTTKPLLSVYTHTTHTERERDYSH